MDKQHDTTAPARDALAAWDKLHNERETLNGNLDFVSDAAYHQPESKVPAETVRQLATAAILLEHTNTLLDKVNERQSRRPSNALDDSATQTKDEDQPESFAIPELLGERRADHDRWVNDVYMAGLDHAKHLRKAESRLAKAKGLAETLRCALLSDRYDPEPFADDVVAAIIDHISKVQEQLDRHGSKHSNLFLAYHEAKKLPDANSLKELGECNATGVALFDLLQDDCKELTPKECAARLRKFNFDVSENLAADRITEDGYTVTKTWTFSGLRYFLAEQQFMERLLFGEGGAT